jgi:hypothetical protein
MDNNLLDLKPALPNKLLQDDGTITDIMGTPVVSSSEAYDTKPALPNKFMNADGSYSTLNEIIAGAISPELFVIVEELPTTGDTSKIYLVPNARGTFDEYIWTGSEWDNIGMLEFDINDYYTKTETNTNFLKKDNTTAYTPNGDYNPATKKYVDDDIVNHMQVYRWNGQTAGAANKAMFQEIYNKSRTIPILIINDSKSLDHPSDYTMNCMYLIGPNNSITNNSINLYPIGNNKFIHTYNSYSSIPNREAFTLQLAFETGTETLKSITILDTGGSDGVLNVLALGYNYSTPYTPQYPGSPATKKYVDDSIANNITNVLGGSY